MLKPAWGSSSVGRAPGWHPGGHGFDPRLLHHAEVVELADTRVSKTRGRKVVRVQLPPSALFLSVGRMMGRTYTAGTVAGGSEENAPIFLNRS